MEGVYRCPGRMCGSLRTILVTFRVKAYSDFESQNTVFIPELQGLVTGDSQSFQLQLKLWLLSLCSERSVPSVSFLAWNLSSPNCIFWAPSWRRLKISQANDQRHRISLSRALRYRQQWEHGPASELLGSDSLTSSFSSPTPWLFLLIPSFPFLIFEKDVFNQLHVFDSFWCITYFRFCLLGQTLIIHWLFNDIQPATTEKRCRLC